MMIYDISKSHGNPIISFLIILLTNQLTNYASRLYNKILTNPITAFTHEAVVWRQVFIMVESSSVAKGGAQGHVPFP